MSDDAVLATVDCTVKHYKWIVAPPGGGSNHALPPLLFATERGARAAASDYPNGTVIFRVEDTTVLTEEPAAAPPVVDVLYINIEGEGWTYYPQTDKAKAAFACYVAGKDGGYSFSIYDDPEAFPETGCTFAQKPDEQGAP